MIQKSCLKQIQIFLRICPISNMLRKTNFLSISVLLSEIVIFGLKREVLCEFLQKCFKTTEKHKFSCMWLTLRRKTSFCLIFPPFYWFDQKQLFKQILNFPLDLPFSNLLRKTNFLSISVLFSEIVTFWTKKWSSLWISPKMLQNNRKA